MTSILLTGATGRIGTCLTRHFRLKGWRVLAVSRSEANLEALERQTKGPGDLTSIVADIADDDGLDEVVYRSRGVSHLVNNARDVRNLAKSGYAEWAAEFRMGVFVPNALATRLAEHENLQSVVNVSSIYGVVAVNPSLYADPSLRSPVHYGVTKAALVHLTRELSVTLAPRIRVNAVSYGGVEGRADADFRRRYSIMTPSGRMLSDEDIPGPVDFLTSTAASAVTGINMMVDGGWTAW